MEQYKQSKRRSNQNSRVKDKCANPYSEILLLRAEEDIRSITAAIIALLHLGVGDQIRHLLIYINLLGRDRTICVSEECAIELLFPGEDRVD